MGGITGSNPVASTNLIHSKDYMDDRKSFKLENSDRYRASGPIYKAMVEAKGESHGFQPCPQGEQVRFLSIAPF